MPGGNFERAILRAAFKVLRAFSTFSPRQQSLPRLQLLEISDKEIQCPNYM
jgi:hypothetical protein